MCIAKPLGAPLHRLQDLLVLNGMLQTHSVTNHSTSVTKTLWDHKNTGRLKKLVFSKHLRGHFKDLKRLKGPWEIFQPILRRLWCCIILYKQWVLKNPQPPPILSSNMLHRLLFIALKYSKTFNLLDKRCFPSRKQLCCMWKGSWTLHFRWMWCSQMRCTMECLVGVLWRGETNDEICESANQSEKGIVWWPNNNMSRCYRNASWWSSL